ncbi:MAG: hypothetical protein R3E58_20375 [Phycisphaerae bacterium]
MRAVTHSDSPPQSHQHNPSPSGSLHPRRATHDLFKRSSDPSSPLAERLDALIDAFEARISHCADDLRSALNRAFELDDDSRTELTRDAASDRKRIVSRLAVIVQRLKVMFDVVSSDSPSPRLIDAIWNQTLQLAGSAAAIALDTRGVDPVQAFACGAVCNLGQLVLTVQFPKPSSGLNGCCEVVSPRAGGRGPHLRCGSCRHRCAPAFTVETARSVAGGGPGVRTVDG